MNNVNTYELERDAEMARNTKKKENALANQNASEYFRLCNALGVTPEDNPLYQRGLAERMTSQGKTSGLEKMANNAPLTTSVKDALLPIRKERKRFVSERTYTDFLKEASSYIRTDFGDYAGKKKEILKSF